MTQKNLLALFLLLTCLTFFSCRKDSNVDNEQFCAFVTSQNFEATVPMIDQFLATQQSSNSAQALQNLRDWLDAKGCVAGTTLLCNSCIKTLPAQSEISVDFSVDGQVVTRTMDILMDETLRCTGFHE